MDNIKQALIDANYPYIHTLSDDEILALFEPAYFPKFLRWFVGEVLSDENLLASYTDTDIMDFLCNFGYCKLSQRKAFAVAGLDFHEQFEIIHHMLSNLALSKEDTNQEDLSSEHVTLQDLNELISKKLDLFPTMSGKKEYSDAERDDQITTLEDQIRELEERFAEGSYEEEETYTNKRKSITKTTDIPEKPDLSASIDKFLICTSKLTELESNIKEAKVETVGGKFSDDFVSKLSDYCLDAVNLEEYFDNLNIVDDFNENKTVVDEAEEPASASAVDKLLKLTELM